MGFALLFNNLFITIKTDLETEFDDNVFRLEDILSFTEKNLDRCVEGLNIMDKNAKLSPADCDKYLSSFPKTYFKQGNEFLGYFYAIEGNDNNTMSWYYNSSSGVLTDLQLNSINDIFAQDSVKINEWCFVKRASNVKDLIYVVPITISGQEIGYMGAVINLYFTQNAIFRDDYHKYYDLSFLDSEGNFLFSSNYNNYENINDLDKTIFDRFEYMLNTSNNENNLYKQYGFDSFIYKKLDSGLTFVCEVNVLDYQKQSNITIIFVALVLILCFIFYHNLKRRENDITSNIYKKYMDESQEPQISQDKLKKEASKTFIYVIVFITVLTSIYSFFVKHSFYLPLMLICILLLEVIQQGIQKLASKSDSEETKSDKSDKSKFDKSELIGRISYILDICVVLIPSVFLFFAPLQESHSTILVFFFAMAIIVVRMFCSSLINSMNIYYLSLAFMFAAQALSIIVWKKPLDSSTFIFTAFAAFTGLFVNSAFIVFKYFDDETHANVQILVDKVNDTQSMLVQNDRMTTLGRLMAGLSHEINTPIGAIKASADTFNSRLVESFDIVINNTKDYSPEDLQCLFTFINLSFESVKKMLSTSDLRRGKNKVYKMLVEEGFDDDKAYHIANMLSRIEICNLDKIREIIDILRKDNIESILGTVCDIFFFITGTNTIQLATNKISKIMYALRAYANVSVSTAIGEFNIVESIDSVLTLYTSQFNPSIVINKDYQENIPSVIGNPEGLGQVCTNIIQNALYALKDGGSLTITIIFDEENIYIDFEDTGCGIAEENIDKVFEPLFTTKSFGEGSGLGLGICKNIIEDHGGSISVKSKLGKGTTFFIRLPINKKK